MSAEHDDLEAQVRRLLTGAADQQKLIGAEFLYDGRQLHADDVADLCLMSVLCIAQDTSERLGQGGFGYQFKLGKPSPVFPLEGEAIGVPGRFSQVGPFVLDVFDGEVMECRQDLAYLFQSAAQLLRPDFSLKTNTNYRAVIADTAPFVISSVEPNIGG